jgi:hypothetical protein
MPIISPTTPPDAPVANQGVSVPVDGLFPASSSITIEQDFNTYNTRPRAVPAEIEYLNVSAATSLEFAPIIVRVNAASAGVTITLPLSSSAYGRKVYVVKTDSTGNAVTIVVVSGDNLWRPAAITTITTQYVCQSYLSTSDGTNSGWQYVGGA